MSNEPGRSIDWCRNEAAAPVRKARNSMRTITLPRGELGRLVFGQLHLGTQEFFLEQAGQLHTVPLFDFPHYRFLADSIDDPSEDHIYGRYLKASWNHLYPAGYPMTIRERTKRFVEFYEIVASRRNLGALAMDPILVCPRPDGRMIVVHGNHRSSVALKLGIDLRAVVIPPREYLRTCASIAGTHHQGPDRSQWAPQSVFDRETELVRGRRSDILDLMSLVRRPDIEGKTVLELGCRIGANLYFALQRGARSAVGVDGDSHMVDAALRLAPYFGKECRFYARDLSKPVCDLGTFDTVLLCSGACDFESIDALRESVAHCTGSVLYFEGDEMTTRDDYPHLLDRDLFRKVKLLGFTRGEAPSSKWCRPLFRCER